MADKPVAPASTTTLRVRYAETDRMGVVYYANYLVWFEVARADLLRTLGWTYREMEESGVYLPVIEAHCEYRRPARYDDDVEIRTTGSVVSAGAHEFRVRGSASRAAPRLPRSVARRTQQPGQTDGHAGFRPVSGRYSREGTRHRRSGFHRVPSV